MAITVHLSHNIDALLTAIYTYSHPYHEPITTHYIRKQQQQLGEEDLPPLSTYLRNTVRNLRRVEPPNSFSFRRWRSNLPMDPRGRDNDEDEEEEDEDESLSMDPYAPRDTGTDPAIPEEPDPRNGGDALESQEHVHVFNPSNDRINIINFYNNPNFNDPTDEGKDSPRHRPSGRHRSGSGPRLERDGDGDGNDVRIPIGDGSETMERKDRDKDQDKDRNGSQGSSSVAEEEEGESTQTTDYVRTDVMVNSDSHTHNTVNNGSHDEGIPPPPSPGWMRGLVYWIRMALLWMWQKVWERKKSRIKYGTIIGVLLPCLQIVLGVILFLRLPLIIGQAGIGFTLLIAGLSILPTFFTVLSLSAIASNGRIPSGGMYFMISRTLGADVGGAIGFLFFLGTAATATLYILGAAETALLSIPALDMGLGTWNIAVLGLCILVVLFLVVFFGLRYVSVFGTGLFACVIISMLSLFVGIFLAPQEQSSSGVTGLKGSTFTANWGPEYTDGWDFITLLALFYPSQIGMIAGANRSGDLRQPGTAIPMGTIAALIISAIVYVLCILMFGSVAERSLLVKDDFLPFASLAWPTDWIVRVGILLVSIGAGLQSFTNAPRLLQAISNDGIIPVLRFIRDPAGREPRRAMVVVALLSSLAMLFRNLDEVAPVISMLVLLCYAFVNLSCLSLSVSRAPNWRPHFRFYHWSIAGIGFLANVVTMFLIRWYWALVAFVLSALLYKYIEYKGQEANWGHGLKGLRYQQARNALLTLEQVTMSAENWRPQVLALAKTDAEYGQLLEPKLLEFVNQLKKGRGLCILGTVVPGTIEDRSPNVESLRELLKMHMKRARIAGFVDPVIAPTVDEGLRSLLQLSGIGNFSPNTVVMGYPSNWQKRPPSMLRFVDMVHQCHAVSKALIAIKNHHLLPNSKHRFSGKNTIDVWWILHDGGLLMLLPFLLKKHKTWARCRLRVFAVAERRQNVPKIKKDLQRLIYDLRIPAVVHVVPLDDGDLLGYMYHKTLQLEKRRQILEQLGVADNDIQNKLSSITGALVESTSSKRLTPLSAASSAPASVSASASASASVSVSVSVSSEAGRRTSSRRGFEGDNNIDKNNNNNNEEEGRVHDKTENGDDSHSDENGNAAKEGNGSCNEEEKERSKHDNGDGDGKDEEGGEDDSDSDSDIDPTEGEKEEDKYTYDEKTLLRMKTAIALNTHLKTTSQGSTSMVLINLPYPSPDQLYSDYMEFLEAMCEDVDAPIMLVRGTGRQVVTHYE